MSIEYICTLIIYFRRYIFNKLFYQQTRFNMALPTVRQISRQRNHQFDVESITWRVTPDLTLLEDVDVENIRLRNEDRLESIANVLINLLDDITSWLRTEFDLQDRIQISMYSETLDREVSLPMMTIKGFGDGEPLLDKAMHVLNSNENFELDDSLTFEVERVPFTGGGGHHKNTSDKIRKKLYTNLTDFTVKNKSCLVPPENVLPGFCGPVSLILAAKHAEGLPIPKRCEIQQKVRVRKKLEREAKDLMVNAGFSGFSQWPEDKRLSVEDIKDIVEANSMFFRNYAISILDIDHGNSVLFSCNEEEEKQINIGLVLNHLVVIKNMPGFFNCLKGYFWCPICMRMCNSKQKHKCVRAMCSQCKPISGCQNDNPRSCRHCKRVFKNEQCFENHILTRVSPVYENVCKEIRACGHCKADLQCDKSGKFKLSKDGYRKDAYKKGKAAKHVCFARICFICGVKYDRLVEEHKCYVRPLSQTQIEHLQQQRQTITNYYFDLETRVDKDENGLDVFKVNVAVIQQYDPDYTDIDDDELGADPLTYIFTGDSALKDLNKFFFFGESSLLNQKIKANIWSHNGGRFDIHFILAELVEHSKMGAKPKVISAGKTIKMFSIGTLKFLDSKMFLPMALSQFSKTFSVPVKKGWFPHKFNVKENEEYEGPIPDKTYFEEKLQNNEEFKKWHAKLRSEEYVWNFLEEITAYCVDDVQLLMMGMEKFSRLVYDLTGVFPGGDNCSLASMANQAWRKNFLPKVQKKKKDKKDRRIGVVPEQGYSNKDNQSKKALQWLQYMNAIYYGMELQMSGSGLNGGGEKKVVITRDHPLPQFAGRDDFNTVVSERAIKFQERETKRIMEKTSCSLHVAQARAKARYFSLVASDAKNGKPTTASYGQKIVTYKLDGFHPQTNTALEFYGCLFHGCLKCYEKESISPFNHETMEELYKKTMQREKDLREVGLEVESIWECEWDALVNGSAALWAEEKEEEVNEVQSSLDELGLSHTPFETIPMKPRESMRGGRTNARKMLHLCKDEGEEICYNDVTSLYPTVMSKCLYPVGHPNIITANFDYTTNAYFGVCKAVVLPPQDLWHPVLPVGVSDSKNTEKLMFPLCNQCAVEANFELDSCLNHTVEQRCIQGCWTTPELYLAVEMGYSIQKFFEVWHYEQQTDEYFKSYIQTFFKLKAQAKGYPAWANTDAKKAEYLIQFRKDNGIDLDPNEMRDDKAMYNVAKSFLNTLWGYFGKDPHKGKQNEFVTDAGKFSKWVNRDDYFEKNFILLNDNVMLTQHKVRGEFKPTDVKGSMVHAAFTTAHARVHLYNDCLHPLGPRVVYFDTDSVIYIKKKYQNRLPLGDKLGDLTDEIESVQFEGETRQLYCSGFVSGGPKNYAMELCLRNRDGSIPPYTERQVHSFKTVIRGFSLSKEAQKILNFEKMCEIVFRSAAWANTTDEFDLEKLAEEEPWVGEWLDHSYLEGKGDGDLYGMGGEIEASGIINFKTPTIERTSFELGDRQPIRGVNLNKRKLDDVDDPFDENTDDDSQMKKFSRKGSTFFRVRPHVLARRYRMVITKGVPILEEGPGQFFIAPFGYVDWNANQVRYMDD